MFKKYLFAIIALSVSLLLFTKLPLALATTSNLVPNASLETSDSTDTSKPQDWLIDNWGNNTASFTYVSDGHTGSKSLRVEITKYKTGDTKWYYASQPATSGASYAISDYYKSNITSRIVIMFNLTNGTQEYIELKEAPASADWTQYQDYVVAPANTVSMSVFHLISKVGWLQTDDYSVTDGTVTTPVPTPTVTPTSTPTATPTSTPTTTPSPTPTVTPTPTPTSTPTPLPSGNAVPNFSVENGNTVPNSWVKESWGNNTAKFTYVKNDGHPGSRSLKVQLSKYVDGDAKWYFKPIAVTPGDTWTVSDSYKSNIVSHFVIDFENTDATHYYLELKTAPASSSWSNFSESFQVPFNAKTMTVLHLIHDNGWLQTDNYRLVRSYAQGFDKARVTFAFDDGWEDDSVTAVPVMNLYGFKGTFFFATTFLSTSPLTGPVGVSGPETVKYLYNQGYEVGGHTVTHPDLTTLNDNDLNAELLNSKTYLEGLVGAGNVLNFASPYGAYNDHVISKIKPLYRSHRPTDEGFNTVSNYDLYRLKVQNMEKSTTMAQYMSWINEAIKDKSWLILVYHRVAATDLEEFDTPVTDFTSQMKFVHDSGISVQTMNQAINETLPQK